MPAAIPTEALAGNQTPTLALKFALSHLMRKQAVKTTDFCGKRRIVSAFLRNSTSTSSCSKRTRSRFAPSRTANCFRGQIAPPWTEFADMLGFASAFSSSSLESSAKAQAAASRESGRAFWGNSGARILANSVHGGVIFQEKGRRATRCAVTRRVESLLRYP